MNNLFHFHGKATLFKSEISLLWLWGRLAMTALPGLDSWNMSLPTPRHDWTAERVCHILWYSRQMIFSKSLSIWTVSLDCRANMKKYPVVFEQCNKLFEHCKNRELPSLLDQALFKFGEKCKHSNSTNLKLKHRKNCECCPGHYLIVYH